MLLQELSEGRSDCDQTDVDEEKTDHGVSLADSRQVGASSLTLALLILLLLATFVEWA